MTGNSEEGAVELSDTSHLSSRECPPGAIAVGNIRREAEGSETVLSAEVSIPGYGISGFHLWYRIREECGRASDASANCFLAAMLPLAMEVQRPLWIDGSVSPRLLSGCKQIMRIWSKWGFCSREIPIIAAAVKGSTPAPNALRAIFFTGGVDSFYSLLKHRDCLDRLVFVHGFDIGLTDIEQYQLVESHLEDVAKRLGKTLLIVSTNLRALADLFLDWATRYHGAGLASVGLAFEGNPRTLLIPSSFRYADVIPWGSHPLVDPLWSTEGCSFVHDGNEASRPEKIRLELARSEVALAHLRVCWESKCGCYNCGVCEKCLRTMLSLKIANALDLCATLPSNLSPDDFTTIGFEGELPRYFIGENLEALESLEQKSEAEQYRKALIRVLKHWYFPSVRLRRLLRKADFLVSGGRLARAIKRMRVNATMRVR